MKGLVFTYLLTYGGALAALFNPFIGLLIYVCFAIVKPEALWSFSLPQGGQYSRIVAIGLLLGWWFCGFGNWKLGRANAPVILLVCFWCWAAIGAPFAAANSNLAWSQVEEYAKIVLPFLVGITTLRTRRQLEMLAWVIALSQGYLAYEFNLIYYTVPGFDPNDWIFAGLDRNGIAINMVAGAGFTFFLGFYASRWWLKLLGLGLAALMVHVVLFSLSRGGMLALIVTAVAVFVLIPKRPMPIAVALLALAIGLRLAGPTVVERFNSSFGDEAGRDYSAESRLELWTACFEVMRANPLLGIGSSNWRLVAHLYGFTEGKDAHTTWLHVGAELGFMGLFFLLSFYWSAVARLWQLARSSSNVVDPWLRCVAHMVITSVVGFAVSAQFVSVYGVELPYYIVLVGAGALKLASVDAESAEVSLGDDPEDPWPLTAAGQV